MRISEPMTFATGGAYVDAIQYVTMDDGSEWEFITTLDREDNRIYDGIVRFSPDKETLFEENGKPPSEVAALHAANKHLAVAFLEQYKS